jgi:hypothetical protein
MAQQTAVEWLVEQLLDGKLLMPSLIDQAKAIEKEQIIDAATWGALSENNAEQYYNEKYNK